MTRIHRVCSFSAPSKVHLFIIFWLTQLKLISKNCGFPKNIRLSVLQYWVGAKHRRFNGTLYTVTTSSLFMLATVGQTYRPWGHDVPKVASLLLNVLITYNEEWALLRGGGIAFFAYWWLGSDKWRRPLSLHSIRFICRMAWPVANTLVKSYLTMIRKKF